MLSPIAIFAFELNVDLPNIDVFLRTKFLITSWKRIVSFTRINGTTKLNQKHSSVQNEPMRLLSHTNNLSFVSIGVDVCDLAKAKGE